MYGIIEGFFITKECKFLEILLASILTFLLANYFHIYSSFVLLKIIARPVSLLHNYIVSFDVEYFRSFPNVKLYI